MYDLVLRTIRVSTWKYVYSFEDTYKLNPFV
jgi:hypothetical protein